MPLAGEVELSSDTVAFRSAPEAAMVVTELTPCSEIEASFDDALIIELIRAHVDAPGA